MYKYLVQLLDEASKEFRDAKGELDYVSFSYIHFDEEKNTKMLENYGFEESKGNQIVFAKLLKRPKPAAGYDRQALVFMDFNSDEYFPGKVKIVGEKITDWVYQQLLLTYPTSKKWKRIMKKRGIFKDELWLNLVHRYLNLFKWKLKNMITIQN